MRFPLISTDLSVRRRFYIPHQPRYWWLSTIRSFGGRWHSNIGSCLRKIILLELFQSPWTYLLQTMWKHVTLKWIIQDIRSRTRLLGILNCKWVIWAIVILKTPVWKLMKRYCCMFLIMFSLSVCVLSSVQGTWENQVWIKPGSFNTVLANQSESAQSFLAKSNIPPS